MAGEVRLRPWRRGLPLLLALLLAGGCSRLPKIIVLEDPLTAAEHVELGVAYERKGELDLARREYERALRKDGKFFRARVNLGNIFLAKKEFGKAREEYLLALELRPGNAEATNNLSWAAIFSGRGVEEALARMESVVSGPPGGRQPIFLDTLGVLRMHANRPGEAEEAFALAETLCRQAGAAPREGVNDDAPCPEEVLREIEDHRGELRRRFPPTSPAPAN
ncbi:tetratricopeptide repeat protein [Candidatus Deferrimicrobium sp.]|uniref:tetratricopeptide repeat protein n=1 Tax=Candidatus Deferrimicrobium sp. TaxID=3060586 RepID=UPI003C4CB7B8